MMGFAIHLDVFSKFRKFQIRDLRDLQSKVTRLAIAIASKFEWKKPMDYRYTGSFVLGSSEGSNWNFQNLENPSKWIGGRIQIWNPNRMDSRHPGVALWTV